MDEQYAGRSPTTTGLALLTLTVRVTRGTLISTMVTLTTTLRLTVVTCVPCAPARGLL